MQNIINLTGELKMGNLPSRVLSSRNPTIQEIVLEFLNSVPSERAIRLLYGNNEDLQPLVSEIKLSSSFGPDLIILKELLDWCRKSPSINDLADEYLNLITASLTKISKIDRLFSNLVSISLLVLEREDSCNLGGVICAEKIIALLLLATRGILRASGGDPVHFANASTWRQRLQQLYSILKFITNLFSLESGWEFTVNLQDLGGLSGNADEPELVISEFVSRLALYLVENGLYKESKTISSFMLVLLDEFIIKTPSEYSQFLNISLGRSQVALGELDDGVHRIISFANTADRGCINFLGLSAVDNFSEKEALALYCFNLKEFASNYEGMRKLCIGLLKILPNFSPNSMEDLRLNDNGTSKNNLRLRDQIYEKLISLSLDAGDFLDAHDFVMEIGDGPIQDSLIELIIKKLIHSGEFTLVLGLNWSDAKSPIVEQAIERHIADNGHSFNNYLFLYSWFISRLNFLKAATIMYQFSQLTADDEEQCRSLELAINCLKLETTNNQWIASVRQDQSDQVVKLLDLQSLKSNLLHVKAKLSLNVIELPVRGLCFRLLESSQLALCIELVINCYQDNWDLVISFLISSMKDSTDKNGNGRPWLNDVLRLGMFDKNITDSPEESVLCHFLSVLDKQDVYFFTILLVIQHHLQIPNWLKLKCLQNADRLIKILCRNEQFDLVADILKNAEIRNNLTPGTIAYLRLISQT